MGFLLERRKIKRPGITCLETVSLTALNNRDIDVCKIVAETFCACLCGKCMRSTIRKRDPNPFKPKDKAGMNRGSFTNLYTEFLHIQLDSCMSQNHRL